MPHPFQSITDLIIAAVDAYAKEPSVFVKRQMTLKIVEQIEEKGGFLRWSSKNGDWETVDLEERRQKVAHALQYRIRLMNNTNGGKRKLLKAMTAAEKKQRKMAGTVPGAIPTSTKPQQLAAITQTVVPAAVAPAVASVGSTTNQIIQLTEDERLFVRNFVHNKEDEDGEAPKDGKVASAVSLAARAVAAEAVAANADSVDAINKAAADAINKAVAESLPTTHAAAKAEGKTLEAVKEAPIVQTTDQNDDTGVPAQAKADTTEEKGSVAQDSSSSTETAASVAAEDAAAHPTILVKAVTVDAQKTGSTVTTGSTVPSPLDKLEEPSN